MGDTAVTSHPGRRPWPGAVAALLVALSIGAAGAWAYVRERIRTTPPEVRHVALLPLYADHTPIALTVHAGNAIAPWTATADEVRTSLELWRRMHLANWNVVPEGLRSTGLANMVFRFRSVLIDPRVWDAMDAADWDAVPQPVRTIAFRNMAAYWAGYYGVGRDDDLPRRLVADTLCAIVMSESWFDHRAAVEDTRTGNRDIGLAQASTFARERMRQLHAAGVIDVAYEDHEYFDPWRATRFLAIWFGLLLGEANGELDTAIGAYHRGIARALDERGLGYTRIVHQRRHRFIRNLDAPPAWTEMWTHGRMLERQVWPWIDASRLDDDAWADQRPSPRITTPP